MIGRLFKKNGIASISVKASPITASQKLEKPFKLWRAGYGSNKKLPRAV